MVGDEEWAFWGGRGDVDVEDCFSGRRYVREIEFLGEVIGPGKGVEGFAVVGWVSGRLEIR